MPRITSRVFTDLAIWMTGFGLAIGLVFPPFCLVLGLPSGSVLTPVFYASTLAAGLAVGAANFGLARLVVGRRLRSLAAAMTGVEAQLASAVYSQDWSACDPQRCALTVDSDDEAGATARAFNSLIGTLARSHAVEAAMHDFSGVLSREFELEGLGTAALDGLIRHTAAQAGAMLVIREQEIVPLASHGIRGVEALATSDHVRRVIRLGRTEHLQVGSQELVVDSLLVGVAAREILVIPVVFKSVPLGVLVLATAAGFGRDDIELVDHLRADLGLAVNNTLAHERLERLAAIDPLTEAYNRRFGLGRLREEYSRAVRAEGPFAVLMLDVDNFKAVNDTYGHLVGDRALRKVAAACRRAIRDGDVLIRYGGEEFLVLLPGAGADDLHRIGERILRVVAETPIEDGSTRINVTVSVGAASFSDAVDTPEALVGLADGALYEAKHRGRNRLVVA
jgi:two-component system cell cycle response regulator